MCSEARKDAVLRKLLRRGDPRGRISAATFYHWRKGARGLGHLPPDADLIAEGRASRDKFAAVLETAGVTGTRLGGGGAARLPATAFAEAGDVAAFFAKAAC